MIKSAGRFKTAEARWAGVGPYYAMFPSAFCDRVILKYSAEGDTVLDPFAGRGTALYSAATAGRCALGMELNPVGWVYSRTKLSPAERIHVENRILQLQAAAHRYSGAAQELPAFFKRCFTLEVRRYLLCARELLNWRQNKTDRTLMAFLLIHLHGKISDSFSNQMRQTKAMSPKYALAWWKARSSKPPRIDPATFLLKKLEWRYKNGKPVTTGGRVYLGDSVRILSELTGNLAGNSVHRPSLLLTSPPYFGITNYHYDQWLRLWLLGGPPTDRRTKNPYNGKYKGKFGNLATYEELLVNVFDRASHIVRADAVIYVRTDSRKPTLDITRDALEKAFPKHSLREIHRPVHGKTQTRLFGNGDPRFGEVDLLMTR